MPTDWERGFAAGWNAANTMAMKGNLLRSDGQASFVEMSGGKFPSPKRKLSQWQRFVKANSKKSKYIYKSGAKKGKLNLKKMGVDYRKKKR